MGYSVMFWYIYTLYIDQLRILRFSIISNIYHLFMLKILKIFCFEFYDTILLIVITLCVINHQNFSSYLARNK